jgi:hypothetical protein
VRDKLAASILVEITEGKEYSEVYWIESILFNTYFGFWKNSHFLADN